MPKTQFDIKKSVDKYTYAAMPNTMMTQNYTISTLIQTHCHIISFVY